MYILLLLLIIIFIMFFMCMIRIRIEIEYVRKNEDDYFRIKISLLKNLIRFGTEIPVISVGGMLFLPALKATAVFEPINSHVKKRVGTRLNVIKIIRKLPEYIRIIKNFYKMYKPAVKKLCKAVRCHKLVWKTYIGTGNPATTGITVGLGWSIKGILYRYVLNTVGEMLHSPDISVVPCFDRKTCRFEFSCIFDLRIGHIIITGLRIIIITLKNRFSVRRNIKWLTTQLKG